MPTHPVCFGKQWDKDHVECKGGLDPAYKNPRNETHLRDKCSWFDLCNRQMTAPDKPNPPHLPVYRPPEPPRPTPSYNAYVQSRPPLTYSPQMQYTMPAVPPTPPPQPAYTPQVIQPTHYQMPGSQMPQYLTVPEPQDEHWVVRLGRELFRALLKAAGHQLAAYVDSNPLRRNRQ